MALIPGTIPVTGTFAPTDSTDDYAVTDPIYGIDGLRNVADKTVRNAIPSNRRRAGMLVGTQDDGNYWQLLPGPWTFTDADWALFLPADITQIVDGAIAGIEILDEFETVGVDITKINFVGNGVEVLTSSPQEPGQVTVFIDRKLGNKKHIYADEMIQIDADYQYFIYGDFTVEGTVDNYGEIVIANGGIDLLGDGEVNNIGDGTINLVNLATGDSINVAIKTFTIGAGGGSTTVTHNLNTLDFTWETRDGNDTVEVDLVRINNNEVQITATDAVSGSIIFFAKQT